MKRDPKISFSSFILAGVFVVNGPAFSNEAEEAMKTAMMPMVGTIANRFEPYMATGKLEGCQLIFSAVAVDNKYGLGDYLHLTGNIGIMIANGNLGSNLKLVVNRADFTTSPVSFKPSAPTRAYLVKKDFTTTQTKDLKSFKAETPGGLFSVFDFDTGLSFIDEAVKTGHLGVGFNQREGQSDIIIDLDFGVADTDSEGVRKRSSEPVDRFVDCLESVANSIKQ